MPRPAVYQKLLDYLDGQTEGRATVGDVAVAIERPVETTLRLIDDLEEDGDVLLCRDAERRYREQWHVTSIRPQLRRTPEQDANYDRVLATLQNQNRRHLVVSLLVASQEGSFYDVQEVLKGWFRLGDGSDIIQAVEITDISRTSQKSYPGNMNYIETTVKPSARTAQAQQDAADGEVFHMPTVEIEDTPLAAHGDAAELARAAVRLLRDLAAPTMPARKRAVERLLDEALAILDRDA